MNLYPTAARSKIRRLAAGRLISVTGGAAAYTALNYTVWNTHAFAWDAGALAAAHLRCGRDRRPVRRRARATGSIGAR